MRNNGNNNCNNKASMTMMKKAPPAATTTAIDNRVAAVHFDDSSNGSGSHRASATTVAMEEGNKIFTMEEGNKYFYRAMEKTTQSSGAVTDSNNPSVAVDAADDKENEDGGITMTDANNSAGKLNVNVTYDDK